MRFTLLTPLSMSLFLLVACGKPLPPPECPPAALQPAPVPAPVKDANGCVHQALADPEAAAGAFLKEVESHLLKIWIQWERSSWVKATYITQDTQALAARAEERVMAYTARKSAEAVCKFGPYFKKLPQVMQRKFKLLRISLTLPAPRDKAKRAELAAISNAMDAMYGKGKYCPKRLKGKCLTLGDMVGTMASSRNYNELLDLWKGWRRVGVPMREKFIRYVALGNEGARELGFQDLGALWRSGYDMSPAAFQAETDRLWKQVRPLYRDLHCYVRARLQKQYGKDKIPDGGLIPAHVLGNMWAQDWSNLFDMLAPEKGRKSNLAKALKAKKVDARGMVKYAENFFVSLGLDPLPKTFWERSLLVKPRDREVVCHASAWDVDWDRDLRIKMCIKINEEDFTTIHHELGHNYYQRAYRTLDPLFRNSANDGFHEALGDTIALSVTPSYKAKVGLMSRRMAKIEAKGLNPLMRRALEKVAFLPFGILIDRWRWDVFSGKVKPSEYNKHWWDLRAKYQGIAAPVSRPDDAFDPGAKYHIPASVPYTRYFIAAILQFQFHRALCKVAGHKGPLHTCSIFGNKAAGKRLKAMMSMGLSRPWPEALKAITGQDKMDATAILTYFKPLHDWLKKQNKGRKCGW